MTESFCMLSVAPKGAVDCRMVVSCVFCSETWRKIFLALASGMLNSQVKPRKSSAFPTSSGKSGDSCCSRMFLTIRHGLRAVVAVVFGTGSARDLSAGRALSLRPCTQGSQWVQLPALPSLCLQPLLTASKIPLTTGGHFLIINTCLDRQRH